MMAQPATAAMAHYSTSIAEKDGATAAAVAAAGTGPSSQAKLFPAALLSNAERDELHTQIYYYFKWLEQSLLKTNINCNSRQSAQRASDAGMSITAIQCVICSLHTGFTSIGEDVKVLDRVAEGFVKNATPPFLERHCGVELTKRLNENSARSEGPKEVGKNGESTKSWNDHFSDLTEHRIFMNSCSYPELNARCSGLGDWLWKQRFLYAEKDAVFMKNYAPRLNAIAGFQWTQGRMNRRKNKSQASDPLLPAVAVANDASESGSPAEAELMSREVLNKSGNAGESTKSWNDRFADLTDHRLFMNSSSYSELNARCSGLGDWLWKQRFLYAEKDEDFVKDYAPKLNAIAGFQWTQNENSTSSKVLNESGNDGKSTKSWNDSFADLTEHRIFMNSSSYSELNARCSGLGDWLWKQRFLYAEKDEDFMKNYAPRLNAIAGFQWTQARMNKRNNKSRQSSDPLLPALAAANDTSESGSPAEVEFMSIEVLNESGTDGESTKSWNDYFADLMEHRSFMNSCSYPELNRRCSGLGDWLWKQRFLYAEKYDDEFMKNYAPKLNAIAGFQWTQARMKKRNNKPQASDPLLLAPAVANDVSEPGSPAEAELINTAPTNSTADQKDGNSANNQESKLNVISERHGKGRKRGQHALENLETGPSGVTRGDLGPNGAIERSNP